MAQGSTGCDLSSESVPRSKVSKSSFSLGTVWIKTIPSLGQSLTDQFIISYGKKTCIVIWWRRCCFTFFKMYGRHFLVNRGEMRLRVWLAWFVTRWIYINPLSNFVPRPLSDPWNCARERVTGFYLSSSLGTDNPSTITAEPIAYSTFAFSFFHYDSIAKKSSVNQFLFNFPHTQLFVAAITEIINTNPTSINTSMFVYLCSAYNMFDLSIYLIWIGRGRGRGRGISYPSDRGWLTGVGLSAGIDLEIQMPSEQVIVFCQYAFPIVGRDF